MIYSKHRFTLEIQSAHAQIAVPVTLGDTGTKLYIALTDGGKPFNIPDGTLAMITVHRSSGTYLQAFCSIKNNTTVVYDFMQNPNTAAVEGIYSCELTLYDATAGSVISTAWFTMIVNARVINYDSIEITDDNRSAIDAMIAEEAVRQVSENSRVNAEAERVAAESERVAAESERVAAEEERVRAELARVEAEAARVRAEESRVLAEEERKRNSLPKVTTTDDGKVLTVVGGKWVAEAFEEYDGEVEIS